MGITSQSAVDELAAMIAGNKGIQDGNNGIAVYSPRNGMDTFHAKGWHFQHRDGCPGVAIIGSSNLSKPALISGTEYNVRVPWYESAGVIGPFDAKFEDLWGRAQRRDSQVYFYDEGSRERFRFELESYLRSTLPYLKPEDLPLLEAENRMAAADLIREDGVVESAENSLRTIHLEAEDQTTTPAVPTNHSLTLGFQYRMLKLHRKGREEVFASIWKAYGDTSSGSPDWIQPQDDNIADFLEVLQVLFTCILDYDRLNAMPPGAIPPGLPSAQKCVEYVSWEPIQLGL
ncbi:helicase [Diplodia corticola]|uniref:Helicase n=1 Tax=Diplodia corticola TaxID=236234 RepID=A0A1J9RBS9_9PEZI|nr:helicase [Diplodia corticola]OJD38016.1 helicase [Diplodia corticola]